MASLQKKSSNKKSSAGSGKAKNRKRNKAEKSLSEPDRITPDTIAKTKKQSRDYSTGNKQAWIDVISAGMSLLEKITGAVSSSGKTQKSLSSGGLSLPQGLLATDESTGQPYLKHPLPKPEILKKLADILNGLV